MEKELSPEFDPKVHWEIPVSSQPDAVLRAFSNELKHPLNSIRGWVKILADSSFETRHPEAREMIVQNVERVEWLIGTVKAYLEIYQSDATLTDENDNRSCL